MDETFPKHARLTEADRKALVDQVTDMYARKLSIRAISEQVGRSYGNVHRMLVEAGVDLRPRGGNTRPGLTKTAQRDYLDRLREVNPARRKQR